MERRSSGRKRRAPPATLVGASAPETPTGSDEGTSRKRLAFRPRGLLDLPNEILEHCLLRNAEAHELCSLAATCTRLRALADNAQVTWRELFAARFGEVSDLQQEAASLAGSWKRLFAARAETEREAAPWQKPSGFELDVAVRRLAWPNEEGDEEGTGGGDETDRAPPTLPLLVAAGGEAAESSPPGGASPADPWLADSGGSAVEPPPCLPRLPPPKTCVVFMLDGSGSVTEDDFSCMAAFVARATAHLAGPGGASRTAMVAVLQFSNEVRVEMAPELVDAARAGGLLSSMRRMNGGTNISLAISRAGALLRDLPDTTHRVLALLTDGRIDGHQAREAAEAATRLADEQKNVRLHAFGVGRGVDRPELLRVIRARRETDRAASGRYVGLCVLDESPWRRWGAY